MFREEDCRKSRIKIKIMQIVKDLTNNTERHIFERNLKHTTINNTNTVRNKLLSISVE